MTNFGGKVCESSMNKNQARFYSCHSQQNMKKLSLTKTKWKCDHPPGSPGRSGALFKPVKCFSSDSKPFSLCPAYQFTSLHFSVFVPFEQTQPCKENNRCLSRLQLCQRWSYLIQTEACWAGVCRIKTLCVNEAFIKICSPLDHHTCIFLSNFLSGKVRESWTGKNQ